MSGRHVSDQNRYQSVLHIWTDSSRVSCLVVGWSYPELPYQAKYHMLIIIIIIIIMKREKEREREGRKEGERGREGEGEREKRQRQTQRQREKERERDSLLSPTQRCISEPLLQYSV